MKFPPNEPTMRPIGFGSWRENGRKRLNIAYHQVERYTERNGLYRNLIWKTLSKIYYQESPKWSWILE